MIVLEGLTKVFSMHGQHKVVADHIDAVFPTGVSVGLVGANGAGKSTLLKLIAGTSSPTSGRVLSTGSVSFPVGLASSMHGDLTGAQNTRFVARIYGADTDALMDWVEEFAELGPHFHLPVRSYSSGMRGRLSFGINMGLAFDTYLIDEITAVGDASFKRKSSEVFHARMEKAGAVYVSHSMGSLRELCQAGAMLENGRLTYYEDIEEAIERYQVSLDPNRARPVVLPVEARADTRFPAEARMLYVMGLRATLAPHLLDCLRRSKACHTPPVSEINYFDARAGRAGDLVERRMATLQELGGRLEEQDAAARRITLRLMGETSALLRIYEAPPEGPDRHDAYIDYLEVNYAGQAVICDPTQDYALLGATEFVEMSEIGEAVLCTVLRDPVSRLWEAVCGRLPARRRKPEICEAAARALVEAGPEAALAEFPEADYARLVSALDASVAEARRVVLFHERLAEPETRRAELARLTDALGIAQIPEKRLPDLPDPLDLPPLPAALAAELKALLAGQYAAMRARFGAELPMAWRLPGPGERPPPEGAEAAAG